MPFSDLKSGWLLEKHGRIGTDLTAEYKALCAKCSSGDEKYLLSNYDVNRIVILLVPGLFTNHYPGYMKENIHRLKKLGLDVRKAKVSVFRQQFIFDTVFVTFILDQYRCIC